jgi:hypothetical protein
MNKLVGVIVMPVLNHEKFVKLISYCLGSEIPQNNPLRRIVEAEARKKNMLPLGAYYLRGLDMEGVIALIEPKKSSKDGLDHYSFLWFSNPNSAVAKEAIHATLQIKSLSPPQFSLRGSPEMFVRVLGESSMIQGLLVDLIDDLKCLERFTIYNKSGSQKDAVIVIPEDLITTNFIVQTTVSEEATKTYNKVERMEIALPQLIDLANYSIMTGLKMFGPMEEFTNFCPHCGKKLPHGKSKFCIHCGKELE